jgi:hypothetical protein
MAEMFVASRWTRGNFLFPDVLQLDDNGVVKVKRRLLGTNEESIAYAKIASVHLNSGIVFATLRIESTGGSDPMIMSGLTRGEAHEARRLIQDAQARWEEER